MEPIDWKVLGGGAVAILILREVFAFLKTRSENGKPSTSKEESLSAIAGCIESLVVSVREFTSRGDSQWARFSEAFQASQIRQIEMMARLTETLTRIETKLDRWDKEEGRARV